VLSADGRTSIGKWAQAGKEFDLTFHKVDAIPVEEPAEIWSGSIDALFQKLTLRIRVYRQDDGTESVYFDSVSQKASGFKATRTIEANNGPSVSGRLKPASEGRFKTSHYES
jgi:hypothetical protein